MRPDDSAPAPAPVLLADYAPPPYLIDTVRLTFELEPQATRVTAALAMRRNPAAPAEAPQDLRFDGRGLRLLAASLDGRPLPAANLALDEESLTVPAALIPQGGAFLWECVTEIAPVSNAALEGLYMSKGMYCTQCEAQGFRKITYFLDRPDVMAVYEVRIEAERSSCPVLLSNGDPVARGELPEGRHFAEWRDPHRKPSYLFALVAGNLVSHEDRFTTASGKPVDLRIYVRPGDEDRCAYAMDSLKRAMTWDEEAYGCEYDLGLFMIVAVDDFNMGAMENKGLNIFNSKYVLASPETATDATYVNIESIVAHEYFHNWTGDRVTCRDWFQLTLKEGLTVFRDQKFTQDQRSRAVHRIADVIALRGRQFDEDAGPLAHPPRPRSYLEINNFYTATVYEKGAEIVGMLHRLLGPEFYRKATDLYLGRHDGEAATLEQFLACFEEVSGRDLKQFFRWWTQAGTPRLKVSEAYDPEARRYALTVAQQVPPTPGEPKKEPLHVPLAVGLLGANGAPLEIGGEGEDQTRILELTAPEQVFVFEGIAEKPVLSFLRDFSAPVIVERETEAADRAFLLIHDPDPFNRWEAGRDFARSTLRGLIREARSGAAPAGGEDYAEALAAALADSRLEPAYKALLLATPGAEEMASEAARRGETADPDAIHAAKAHLTRLLARRLEPALRAAYAEFAAPEPYSPDAASAGRRALKNAALGYLARLDGDLAARQFASAANMTDEAAALSALVAADAPQAEAALARFHERWRKDPQLLDDWFLRQTQAPRADLVERLEALTRHPDFEWRTPNRFRALIGGFMANHWRFHAADGSGYRFAAHWIGRMDLLNPQISARIAKGFESWRRYDETRQAQARAAMNDMLRAERKPSKNLYEILGKILG
ncbi:aminopeptidase N [Neomegalonema sp.]|uniref:aminopeptidase N n=1 Tax=Neomegalonema sp. TaxID=2039713 RepID=UPI00261A8C8A|nr:aminopeptidase N [Neomegalonema sp.]MDD2869950.1 aminopeptidase N [Neomegalonema sp.]